MVSVIVPCYNSARTIRECLTSVLNQQTSVPFDVIVVDSSTDDTPQIVEREFPSVQLIHLDKRTFAGTARNIGVRATSSPYCVMVDSDCVARSDLIERIVQRHREGSYAAVGGALRNGTPGSVSGLIGYLMEFKEFMPSTPMRLESSIPTANLGYRRDTLERHGYFDNDMWLAEDILLNWRIHTSGEAILFDPKIEVTHLNRTGWRNVLTYQEHLGKFSAIARRKGGLPGRMLLRYPILIPLLPFVRTARAVIWLGRHDRKIFLVFLLLWPLYLCAASFWTFGFFKEAMAQAGTTSSNQP